MNRKGITALLTPWLAIALVFSAALTAEASRITERPITKLNNEHGVDVHYSAELKKNKDGTVTVNVNFRNAGTDDVVILFCFMIETTKGEGTTTEKEWVLVKEGDTLKCKEDNETNFPNTRHSRNTAHHSSHLGCRRVEIKAGDTKSEPFTTSAPFPVAEVTDRDFELSYADVVLLKKGATEIVKYDPESCRDVRGNDHYLKILKNDGFGFKGVGAFVTEWAIQDEPFKDPYVQFANFDKLYVRFSDWPCIPAEFPLPFDPYPHCPILPDPPPPMTVPINLFDAHTMAKDRTEDTVAELIVTTEGDAIGVQVTTDPPPGVPFVVGPNDLPQGTLTVTSTCPLDEGDTLRVSVIFHDVDEKENLFANVGDFIQDSEPPLVAMPVARFNELRQLEIEVEISDATSDPDEAILWVSIDRGLTWESFIMEGALPFFEINHVQTYTVTTNPIAPGSEVIYFIEAHDTVGNVFFTSPTSIRPSLCSVYMMTGGDSTSDLAAFLALQQGGHQVTVGVHPHVWNGTQANLNEFDAVVILNNFNWNSGSMVPAGVRALVEYVCRGGGIVTGEWLNRNIFVEGRHPGLSVLMPVTEPTWNTAASTTYNQDTPDPLINQGLPPSFGFNLANISGSESSFDARPDTTVFYRSSNGGGRPNSPGLVGWSILNGKVISFSTLITNTELASDDFKQLLSNAVNWVARPLKGFLQAGSQ